LSIEFLRNKREKYAENNKIDILMTDFEHDK